MIPISIDISDFIGKWELSIDQADLLSENAQIDTFINNIPDIRKIDISLRLATSLGF